jgi:putative transposase
MRCETILLAGLTLCHLTVDLISYLGRLLQSRSALAAESLFLRKQLALYQERQVRPRRATDATRLTMVWLGRLFDWKEALIVVRAETFIAWHRRGFKLFWHWKSRRIGRPRTPQDLRQLILAMARDNPTWGQARIAAELLLKLAVQVSPRTVHKYLLKDPKVGRRQVVPSQHWMTFVRNHAKGMLRCDFFISVTIRFQILYVFLVMEVGSRRLVHFNVTSHPTAAWTLQQFREALDNDHKYRFVIHDRDQIYSQDLDFAVRAMGVRILRTPFHSAQANCYCERLIGSLRRECLDFLIPMNERHLRKILQKYQIHYNQGRPHSSLGPGLPEPRQGVAVPLREHRHHLPEGYRVKAKSILGGLHHEYQLETIAA